MQNRPLSQDQINKINDQLFTSLQEVKSRSSVTRRYAIRRISAVVAPNLLLDGYGQQEELVAVSESPFPEAVILPLIDLLKDNETRDKSLILEILFDLSRYESASDLVPFETQEKVLSWARRLRDSVNEGIETYRNLSDNSECGQMARDLIELLASYD